MDRSKLLELLGPFPARVPLEPQLLERMDCGSSIREKISYCTEPEERISAYFCVPKRTLSKMPSVFCHHQHNFQFTMGKSEVVRLVGNPDQAYAAELAERGFITFAPDAIAFEERKLDWGTCGSSGSAAPSH